MEEILVTEQRKVDHIKLAFEAQEGALDDRFEYDPMLAGFAKEADFSKVIAGKTMKFPLWISSMTGGAEKAGFINKRLAEACKVFGLGMGLGSCRIILNDDTFFNDFNLRPIIGADVPFFANLGIAQIEELYHEGKLEKINELLDKLDADGLFMHVNPLQEWTQPEGDRYYMSPLQLAEELLNTMDRSLIIKEVGQGFGSKSIEALLQLPLAAIDFGAHGGTNFAKLELLRGTDYRSELIEPIQFVGHSATEMVAKTNAVVERLGDKVKCESIIISGGVKNFLDGYYLTEKSNINAVYGQAAPVLKPALESQEKLNEFIATQIDGFKVAKQFLTVK